MDIAAMSTMLSQGKIMQQANLSVMKMAMDSAQNSGQMIKDLADTAKIMEQSVNPHLGKNIDIQL
ncbi:putative motility protein [Crassaminicella thermophila]|uniref:Putative motility protein n=1 Tax=Crassaminicella thermophila TaxID=2599308 RepID=A0A5C0SBN2_CRATE|nr:YjfB family protein [Crassaminicella thermophila]QEK11322.1 putative motility protein [Crassaminicella thermophila]